MFDKKTILITGGTGSFGKCFVRYLLKNFKSKKFIVFSRDELKQFEMRQDFDSKNMRYFRYVRDKKDYSALEGVDYLVHAAAMKQVPASEYNPIECIKQHNRAQNIVEASQFKLKVALSTDKAANPINFVWSAKLASDKLFVAANYDRPKKNKFSLWYGNVIGSSHFYLILKNNR